MVRTCNGFVAHVAQIHGTTYGTELHCTNQYALIGARQYDRENRSICRDQANRNFLSSKRAEVGDSTPRDPSRDEVADDRICVLDTVAYDFIRSRPPL
eukprot:SAG31_NODE_3483_length_4215_cov_2.188533_1_plen_98_part_00